MPHHGEAGEKSSGHTLHEHAWTCLSLCRHTTISHSGCNNDRRCVCDRQFVFDAAKRWTRRGIGCWLEGGDWTAPYIIITFINHVHVQYYYNSPTITLLIWIVTGTNPFALFYVSVCIVRYGCVCAVIMLWKFSSEFFIVPLLCVMHMPYRKHVQLHMDTAMAGVVAVAAITYVTLVFVFHHLNRRLE